MITGEFIDLVIRPFLICSIAFCFSLMYCIRKNERRVSQS